MRVGEHGSLTADGDVDARLVVDATGRAGRGAAAPRRAYGVVVAAPPAGVEPRADADGPATGRPRRRPADVRATRCPSPTAGSSRRPSSPPARPSRPTTLAPRLAGAHRRRRRRAATERVDDPDRRAAAVRRGPVPRFGAAAGYAHPATGYSVAASLRAAPRVAAAIADAWRPPAAPDPRPVHDAVWPRDAARAPGASTPTGWRCCCASTRTSWRRSSTPSSTCRSTCGRRTCASTRRPRAGQADDDGGAAPTASGAAAAAAGGSRGALVLSDLRTASTQPTATATEKMNHCTA